MEKSLTRGALRAYGTLQLPRSSMIPRVLIHHQLRHQSSAPTVAQLSFWKSLIPKPLRPRPKPTINWGVPETRIIKPKKDWNPATFFIAIFLLVGSMAIQMIALKKDHSTFVRRAETRIGLLREVIERIQRGEEVDVRKTLGAGDAERELEWEEVIREIERDGEIKKAEKTTRAPLPPSSEQKESKPESRRIQDTQPAKSNTGYSNFF